MGRRKNKGAPSAPRREEEQSTRRRLLETAGQVFADKGFDRATGKEICEQAGANAAAINYHFGGMDGLYAAVLQEATSRLVTPDALSAAVADKADARAKLETFLGLIVGVLTGPASSTWVLRVIAREVVAPSGALEAVHGKERLRRIRILRAIVSELMGLPEDSPAVDRGCVSVVAPCLLLLLADRAMLRSTFPNFGFTPEDAPAMVRHLVRFALRGLSVVANDARGGP